MEIAAFKEFESHQVEFIKKISAEFAAIVKSARDNTRTQELLRESQQQAEELAREEEIRQSMEELHATQEGMERLLKEVQGKEAFLKEMLDALKSPIAVFDHQYRILHSNKAMRSLYTSKGRSIDVERADLVSTIPAEEWNDVKRIFDKALSGEAFEIQHEHTDHYGAKFVFISYYSPIRGEKGEVIAATCIFSRYNFNQEKYRQQIIKQSERSSNGREQSADVTCQGNLDMKIVTLIDGWAEGRYPFADPAFEFLFRQKHSPPMVRFPTHIAQE